MLRLATRNGAVTEQTEQIHGYTAHGWKANDFLRDVKEIERRAEAEDIAVSTMKRVAKQEVSIEIRRGREIGLEPGGASFWRLVDQEHISTPPSGEALADEM